MTDAAFGMLGVPEVPPKPRDRFMIGVSEVGIPLRETEDLLEVAAQLIDYAKITDHTGLVDRLSRAWVARKIALYNSHGIPVLVAVDAIRRGMNRKSTYRYLAGRRPGG